jgi:uncharacterized delta-60 repeat protein
MLIPSWLASRKSRQSRATPRTGRIRHRRPAAPPRLERLEDRCVPTAAAFDPTFGNDPTFGHGIVRTTVGGLDDEATHVFVQPNGELRVLGLTQLGDLNNPGDYALTISLYRADGSPDTAFNSAGPVPGTVVTDLTSPNYNDLLLRGGAWGGAWPLTAPVFLPDGSFLIPWFAGGEQLIRFDQNGSRDTAFTANATAAIGDFSAHAFAVQPDGKVLITGSVLLQESPGIADTVLERLNLDGNPDTSFGTNGRVVQDLGLHEELTLGPGAFLDVSEGRAVAVQPDGAILVGGEVEDTGGEGQPGFVASFHPDGSLDTGFGAGGKVLLAESHWYASPFSLALLGPAADTVTFPDNHGGDTLIDNITLQADGKMLVLTGDADWIRLNQNGTVDTGFARDGNGGNGINYPWKRPILDESGRFFFGLNRYNPDGSPDLTFGPGGYGFGVEDDLFGGAWDTPGLAVQSDGKIVGAGYVSTDNGQTWQIMVARFQGDGQVNLAVSPATVQQQLASTVSFLQTSSTDSSLPPVVLAADTTTVGSVVAAVNALPQPPSGTTPRQVNLGVNLAGGSYSDVTASPPLGVTLVINGSGGSTTIVGHSPALTVSSGNVIVENVTLSTPTDDATILVTGGSLTLRNDLIQESTGYNRAAVRITGGTVDLGTAADPGGNTLNVNGAGVLVQNATPNPVAEVGDTFTVDGSPLSPSSVCGVLFKDFNEDGFQDFGESGSPGVSVQLTGTDISGAAVSQSVATGTSGYYQIGDLLPGTYSVSVPNSLMVTKVTVGLNGAPPAVVGTGHSADGLAIAGGTVQNVVNFGLEPAAGDALHRGQTAGIGFWNSRNGQALLRSLDGGTGTQLGDWLADTFANMFGASGGNLAGKSNAQVAAYFQLLFATRGDKLEAQVMATALSVYVTNSTLAGGTYATAYGFTVAAGGGAGLATVNVGSDGAAVGQANGATMTIMDTLLAADRHATHSTTAAGFALYAGDQATRNLADDLFGRINDTGGL